MAILFYLRTVRIFRFDEALPPSSICPSFSLFEGRSPLFSSLFNPLSFEEGGKTPTWSKGCQPPFFCALCLRVYHLFQAEGFRSFDVPSHISSPHAITLPYRLDFLPFSWKHSQFSPFNFCLMEDSLRNNSIFYTGILILGLQSPGYRAWKTIESLSAE